MRRAGLVTDGELARAKGDAVFRQQLVAENLDRLLGELKKLRSAKHTAERGKQIEEGAALAVKLAELLQRIVSDAPRAA